MKIGVCGGYKKAIIAKKLGFDYMEENLSRTAEYNEKEFADCVASYERLALPVYSFNGFFPGTLSLYGEDVSEIRQYTELALSRAHVLGGKVCVIGSGKARHIPNGMDDAFCRSRFTDVVAMCADIADRYGMRVVVEPLRRGETNFIHTAAEAAEIARDTRAKNAGGLVDFFHYVENDDAAESLRAAKDRLWHAHLARPVDRAAPTEADIPQMEVWAALLKDVKYHGCISLECRWGDPERFEAELAEAYRATQAFRQL